MSALTDLQAAVAAAVNKIQALEAVVPVTVTGTPDSALTPLTAELTAAVAPPVASPQAATAAPAEPALPAA